MEMRAQLTEPPATPALVVDSTTVDNNLRRLATYAAQHGLRIRPHTKTHKSVFMARRQLAMGAAGLAVAKVGEAEAMATAFDGATGDLLVAFPVLDVHRAERLAGLARSTQVSIAVDSTQAIDVLAAAASAAGTSLGVLVDLDCGFHRTGCQTPADTLALARQVNRQRGLRLDGLFTYPGHLLRPGNEQREALAHIQQLLAATIDLWRAAGLEVRTVSSGSTPTAFQSHLAPAVTEIRPGTYIYNDMNTVASGHCALDDCAARIVATVVSDAVTGKCVIDAGSKTLAADRNSADPERGFGHIVEYPHAKVTRLTEEHGELTFLTGNSRPRLGERVSIIPNHICPCVNLQQHAWLRSADGTLEPLAIEAQHRVI